MTGETVGNVFLIYGCVSLVATLVIAARQPLIVSYIVTGILVGPLGLGLIIDGEVIDALAAFGILFLLFLLGMEMQPRDLVRQFRKSLITAIISSIIFFLAGYSVMSLFAYTQTESIIIGICMMFSSTIITLKLLPSTTLYRLHLGEILISILLLQDILAVLALLIIRSFDSGVEFQLEDLAPILYLPILVAGCFVFSHNILKFLYARFDLHEYAFLLTIAWCLGVAELAEYLHLPAEIGAFIAGLSVAIMPIARQLDMSLKPLRDFFLILFFFAIGASLDTADAFESYSSAVKVLVPSGLLIFLSVAVKPYVFEFSLRRSGEKKPLAANAGVRLAQASEFSLLVGWSAFSSNLISSEVMVILQLTVLGSFVISSTWVVLKFPNPMSLEETLHRE